MTRKLISSGSTFEKQASYSRAVISGDFCFVAGTTGFDYKTMEMPDSVEEQTRNSLGTINQALEDGGFSKHDIVRAVYYYTDNADVELIFNLVGAFFAGICPAATMLKCELIDAEIKVEIEVTAHKPS